MLRKIISGGQTGADIGGLLAARELRISTGGTAARGWLTEDGPQETVLRSFGLIECDEEGYPARTRANVTLSDGTFLVGTYRHGGSKLTYEVAQELNRPLFHLAFSRSARRIEEFREWLERYAIQTLNVAGNRESEAPGIAEFTRTFLLNALSLLL